MPGKRALSSSRWLATPTGQLLVWHTRAMMQPAHNHGAVTTPPSNLARMPLWPATVKYTYVIVYRHGVHLTRTTATADRWSSAGSRPLIKMNMQLSASRVI